MKLGLTICMGTMIVASLFRKYRQHFTNMF
jgi:hypothetical protein